MSKKLLSMLLVLSIIFTMLPYSAMAEEADLTVGARGDVTEYNIWVAGVQVTDDNKDNITAPGIIAGKVTYNSDNNTLTLNNATITEAYIDNWSGGDKYDTYCIYSEEPTLIMSLIGENTIIGVDATQSTYGIRCRGELTIEGGGSLTVIPGRAYITDAPGNNHSSGILTQGGLTINGVTLSIEGEQYGIHEYWFGVITINNSEISATGKMAGIYNYDSINITGGNVTGIATGTGNESYGIRSNNLTVIGNATVTAIGEIDALNKAPDLSGYANVRILGSTNSTDGIIAIEITKDDIDTDAEVQTYKYLKFEPVILSSACDITEVTAPAGANIAGTDITATVSNETTNVNVDVTVSTHATWKLYSDLACENEIASKTMNLNVGENKAYIEVTAQDGTSKKYTITISRQGSSYSIYVAGVQVTDANKNDIASAAGIAGTVTYNSDTNTLTLTDVNIAYDGNVIDTYVQDLIIVLNGENSVTSTSTEDDNAFCTRGWGSFTFKGDGSLEARGTYSGIYAFDDLIIESGTIKATGEKVGISTNQGSMTISGGNVTAEATTAGDRTCEGYGIAQDWYGTLSITVSSNGTVTAMGMRGAIGPNNLITTNTTHNVMAGNDSFNAEVVTSPDEITWEKPYVKLFIGHTISGTITGNEGNPIEGATVQIQKDGADFGDPVTTAADGTYNTQLVPDGNYTIKVSKSGYVDTVIEDVNVNNSAVTGIDTNITLIQYTITYNANGGSGTMVEGKATYNASFTLPENGFTAPESKQFKAWAIGSPDGEQKNVGETYTFIGDSTIYAIWEDIPVITYTITATAGTGGSISPSGSVTVNQGESQTFNITPNINYSITDVKVDNVSQGKITSYTFCNVTADHIIYATFSYTGSSDSDSDGRSSDDDRSSSDNIISKEEEPVFTDIEGHWAKEDIEFVVSQGLFSGTSDTTFSPNTAMTRGMFVTVLGRMSKADVSGYKESSYTDVKSDAYYMGYIEWARLNNIAYGVGNEMFAPDKSITREQMAVIMQNYAKAHGFKLPKVNEEKTFADSEKISAYAKEAVNEMQMSGIISGKGDNLFDPQGEATRAEVSAVLRRFVKLLISSNAQTN